MRALNRAAIGAQVRVKLSDRTLTRQVESSTGRGNMNELTLHFGLGVHDGPVEVEVAWPYTPRRQRFTTRANRLVTVRMEGDG